MVGFRCCGWLLAHVWLPCCRGGRLPTPFLVFALLSFNFKVWRYSPTFAMSLLSIPSTACQWPSAYMITRSSAYAYSLGTVVGRSEVQVLKRRGARTNPCGKSFLRRRNLLRLPLPVWVMLRLPTRSIITRTMYVSGSNRSRLQMRPWCHAVSWAARQTQLPPSLPKSLLEVFCLYGDLICCQGRC